MRRYFLAKTDPDEYPLDALERDRRTVWDGVTNAQALQAIRQMRQGDRVLIYHSGGESAIVGLAEVHSDARPDPEQPRYSVVELAFLTRLAPPTTLAEVKAAGQFQDWALVRQGRLSTMTVPDSFLTWLRARYPGVAW